VRCQKCPLKITPVTSSGNAVKKLANGVGTTHAKRGPPTKPKTRRKERHSLDWVVDELDVLPQAKTNPLHGGSSLRPVIVRTGSKKKKNEHLLKRARTKKSGSTASEGRTNRRKGLEATG